MKLLLLPTLVLLGAAEVLAGSATWNLDPATAEWETATNWTPATVPNGPTDVATFDVSDKTLITISTDTSLGAIVFNPGASAFSISLRAPDEMTSRFYDVYGAGITNNSGVMQCFVNYNSHVLLDFHNNSTAGDLVTFNWFSAAMIFDDTSNAGQAIIYSNAAGINFHDTSSAAESSITGFVGGTLNFWETSTADRATIVNSGAFTGDSRAGSSVFRASSHAGDATITCLGTTVDNAQAGFVQFVDTSSADRAFLSAVAGSGAGGVISFLDASSGGTASVALSGNAVLSVSLHSAPGVVIGSLDGSGGSVLLGANNLTVGANDNDMGFAGVISDDGAGGSITKIGRGELLLSGANSYSGGTVVSEGDLVVSNSDASAIGSGPVQVLGGALGGGGIIAGDITVGSGAKLAPSAGSRRRTILHTFGALTFTANATFSCRFYARKPTADAVEANGVTIDPGAFFSALAGGSPTLTIGTVLKVIRNDSATPIAGTFANLADGAILTIGANRLQANYEGGDGNDLTLTVVQ